MARRGEWVYDELLCYVSSPLFQAPVMSFMESHCLIFDPSLDDCKEYREIHGGYCGLVTVLLNAFREDTNLTHEQIIKAMAEMSKKADLREVFSGLFELILATESFRLFSRLMTQKNLELQQQALMLIMKQLGHIPESMQLTGKADPEPNKPADGKPSPTAKHEEEILASIIQSTVVQPSASSDKEEIKKSAGVEADLLKVEQAAEKQKLTDALKNLSFDDKPAVDHKPAATVAVATASAAPLPRLTTRPAPSGPIQPMKTAPKEEGTNAAADWIAQAKAENDSSAANAVQNAAATFANMTPEELKKRQEYLLEQRKKLTEMKKKEREKQLDTYEKAQPKTQARPKSSRAARSNLTRPPAPAQTTEDEKQLQMRRAIADRLKAEIIESQQ